MTDTYMDWFANQKAVYWPPASTDSGETADFDNFGQPITTDPVEIDCRWSDKAEEFIDGLGTTQISHAIVLVTQDVEVGGVLMLGELTDIQDAVNIKENPNAWEIRRFDKTPDIDAEEYLGKAYL